MKINRQIIAILILAVVLFPAPVLANGGTALLWFGIIHLFVGNTFIGYIEGGLLSKLFRTPRIKSTAVLIAANYASTWTAMFLLVNRLSNIPNITIVNIKIWFWIFTALSFILTLLIEYPFFWFLLRKHKNAFPKSIKATLIIHSITYLLLFGWYYVGSSSHSSLLTQLNVVPVEQLQPKESYHLYFKSPEESQVIQSNLAGTNQKVLKIADFQALRLSKGSTFGPIPKLTENTKWEYFASVWAGGGISGINPSENLRFRFSLETPFAFWTVSHATHISGDFAVFQLGPDQICILQPQEKKIALIARGTSPVVTKAN